MRSSERAVWLTMVVALMGAIVILLVSSGRPALSFDSKSDTESYMALLSEMWLDMQRFALDQNKVTTQQLAEAALYGTVRALEDPHSTYMRIPDVDYLDEQVDQSFAGIGARISEIENEMTIREILPNSPAKEAGLFPFDVVLKVNDTLTASLPFDEAIELIRGPEDSPVTLTIRREGEAEPQVITIVRRSIPLVSVRSELTKDDIGYISVTNFGGSTAQELRDAVSEMKSAGVKGLILDVRGNPGGLLDAATEVSNLFVCEGVLVELRKTLGEPEISVADPSLCLDEELPLVVLINGNSASASEILAGTIQDTGRGLVIGTRSLGKGSVQSVIRYPSPDTPEKEVGLKLTIALYYTAAGRSVHGNGVVPDLIVPELATTDDDEVMATYVTRNVPLIPLLREVNFDFEAALDRLEPVLRSADVPVNRTVLGRMLWMRTVTGVETPLAMPAFDPQVAKALEVLDSNQYATFAQAEPTYFQR